MECHEGFPSWITAEPIVLYPSDTAPATASVQINRPPYVNPIITDTEINFNTRLYNTFIGFHLIRTIVSLALLGTFLTLMFLPPALMPLLFLKTAALWIQNSIFMASLLNTLATAIIGGILVSTSLKWASNLGQFAGTVLSLFGKILVYFFTKLLHSLGQLLQKAGWMSHNYAPTNRKGSVVGNVGAILLFIVIGIPGLLLWVLGTIINKLAVIPAGEFLYPQNRKLLNDAFSDFKTSPIQNFKIILDSFENTPDTVNFDPPLFTPRLKATKLYCEVLDKIDNLLFFDSKADSAVGPAVDPAAPLQESLFEEAYKILGITNNSSYAEYRAAYKQKMLRNHPDKNKSPEAKEETQKIAEAYNQLKSKFESKKS